jgi:hypothetical protein
LEREDTRDVLKIYTALLGQLSDFDHEKIDTWGQNMEDASQAKLKNSLLRRAPPSAESAEPTLQVNFDAILVKLLREVKYFLLLGLEVSATAMEIYTRAEVFRRHMGNLDLIVNMYNNIMETLLPVEEPLVKSYIDRVDTIVHKGVKVMSWKSHGIDMFITEAKQTRGRGLYFDLVEFEQYIHKNQTPNTPALSLLYAAAVQGELDRVSQTLTGRIRQLAERYATPLPQLVDEVEALAAKVNGHLKKMGAA